MDAKKRIDKILSVTAERVREEVGALLGAELTVSPVESQIQSKEEIFDNLSGKQVFAHVDYSGDLEGVGGLIFGIKGAIRLGGTLIMLPPTELDEVAGREEYSEEIDDSYGEIANIIAGAYTKVFEESYPKKFRFIRKELELLQPMKVDPESDEPVPDQPYYNVGFTMAMGEADLGWLYMLMPAELFGLVEKAGDAEDTGASQQAEGTEKEATAEEASQDGGEQPATAEPEVVKKPLNREKHLKRVENILSECGGRLTEEVSALLGTKVTFSDHETTFITKEDFFFDEVEGKQVMAKLDVVGDTEGKGFLYFSLKGSIHMGGILIMLPPSELENTCNDEDFSEDIKDAYGEIANIVTGTFSLAFEEQYPEKIRVIRKEVQQVVPMKVETESDEPMPNGEYYMSSLSAEADGKELGKLHLLFPSEVLHLEREEQPAIVEQEAVPAAVAEPVTVETGGADQPVTLEPQTEETAAISSGIDPDFDLDKQHKRVDKLLEECRSRMQTEVSELLGSDIKFEGLDNRLVTKEDFFLDELSGKQVMADMDVVGDIEDKSYLFVTLKDAIHTGGVLIMLPSAELENAVAEEEFNDDTGDAYGEIANIIAGVYTAVFEEEYSESLRFIKKGLTQVIPMKVDADSEEPVPDQPYYMSGMGLSIGGESKGKVHMLFPAALLKLEMLGREEELAAAQEAARQQQAQGSAGHAPGSAAGAPSSTTQPGVAGTIPTGIAPAQHQVFEPADILVISDDEAAATAIAAGAQTKGYRIRCIGYGDDVRSAITPELKTVYLVMREVNEQAFGIAINVRAASTLPLIAAGPGWTRSKVIKAVKYGVSDILLTPATPANVEENLSNNLARMAA